MNLRIIATAILSSMVASAQAGTVVCGGTVEALSFEPSSTSGLLMIKLSSINAPVCFCDPETTWSAPGSGYSVPPGVCKALYSTFLAARLSGLPITSTYFDGTAAAACSAVNVRHYMF